MARFTASTHSQALVQADREAIWKALTDPDLLPRLTPYLRHIAVDGDHWRWEMVRLPVLNLEVAPSFTERMTFVEGERIEFTHDPPAGVTEKAAAEGWYVLSEATGGTDLEISLELAVDLSLPRAAAPAVNRVMRKVMDGMGDRFSRNLLAHVGG
jgi:carbon monoxide dehydrogenase subunit G